MRRIIIIFLLLFLALSLCCAGDKLSDTSLREYLIWIDPYLQGLDVDKTPVFITGAYTAKIKDGKVNTIRDSDGQAVALSPDTMDSTQTIIANSILEESIDVLRAAQFCIKQGYYNDLQNDPYAVIPYEVEMIVTEDGIALFPEKERIEKIIIAISNLKADENTEGAVWVQNLYLVPIGISVHISLKDGAYKAFSYGAAFDYVME
jgi:hypothetical protein